MNELSPGDLLTIEGVGTFRLQESYGSGDVLVLKLVKLSNAPQTPENSPPAPDDLQ